MRHLLLLIAVSLWLVCDCLVYNQIGIIYISNFISFLKGQPLNPLRKGVRVIFLIICVIYV
jgi:hypothetical protein